MKAITQLLGIAVAFVILIGYAGPPNSTRIVTESGDSAVVTSFGRTHTIVGAAEAFVGDEEFTVRARSENSEFGVAVAINSSEVLNLRFDPIGISNGSTLRANLYDNDARKQVTVNHYQRSENETDISLALDGLLPFLTSNNLAITTYQGGVATHSEIMSAKAIVDLGTVTTDDEGDWVKTWHVVCVNGDCELYVDPVNTEFEYVTSPGVRYPFEYIGISFKSSVSFEQGILELVGKGIGPINITSEDTDPLGLVNLLAS